MNQAHFTLAILAALCGCTTAVEPPAGGGEVAVLQRINDAAQRCWIKSGDPAFSAYRIIPELDTHSGKPRILMLRAGRTAGLPELVIEVDARQINTYGPAQRTGLAARINRDIVRWGTGGTDC